MKKRNRRLLLWILAMAFLLSGCGILENMPKLPKVVFPTPEATTPAQQESVPPENGETAVQPVSSVPEHGVLVRLERSSREAFDPAEGEQRILRFSWDSVLVESSRFPNGTAMITEKLAALQDTWYTGSGNTPAYLYGYNTMLGAAEDNFTIAQNSGRLLQECAASRTVTVLRADDEICGFEVTTMTDLGNGQPSVINERLYFDTRTGERLEKLPDEPPRRISASGKVRLLELTQVPEGSTEIVDRIVIGDGGEALLLCAEGEVRDFSLWSVSYSDHLTVDRELFYCGMIRDSAVQLALLMPGDLPNTMLRYRDESGEREYLIAMSGEDGHFFLTENH